MNSLFAKLQKYPSLASKQAQLLSISPFYFFLAAFVVFFLTLSCRPFNLLSLLLHVNNLVIVIAYFECVRVPLWGDFNPEVCSGLLQSRLPFVF